MNNIVELKKRLYKDILYTIIFVLISIPLWGNFNVNAYSDIVKQYDNYNYIEYQILNKTENKIMSYNDDDALRLCETNDLIVYNNSNTIDNYSLILKINKNVPLNAEDVKINVNYKIDYLKNYHRYEDLENYYYVLDNDEIVADSQKYIISLWNSNFEKEITNDIEYEFVVV